MRGSFWSERGGQRHSRFDSYSYENMLVPGQGRLLPYPSIASLVPPTAAPELLALPSDGRGWSRSHRSVFSISTPCAALGDGEDDRCRQPGMVVEGLVLCFYHLKAQAGLFEPERKPRRLPEPEIPANLSKRISGLLKAAYGENPPAEVKNLRARMDS